MTIKSPPPAPEVLTFPENAADTPDAGEAVSVPPIPRSRHVVRNIAVTLATQLISWGMTFTVTLYLPRYVGVVDLGHLAFATSLVGLFGMVVPLGTSKVLVREIARDKSRTGELVVAAILFRVPLALLMTWLAIGTIFVLHQVSPNHYSTVLRTLVMIAASGILVNTVNDALGAGLQGQENFVRQSASMLTEKFLSSGLLILLIFLKAPLWALAAVGLFTTAVSLLINVSAFHTLRTELRWPQWATVRLLIASGIPFFAMGVFSAVYNQVDVPLLAFFTDDRTVGLYNIAARLLGSSLFIPVALATALLPSLTRLHAELPAQFEAALRRAMSLVILCAMPIALPMIFLPSKILLGFLHYPAEFARAAPILAIYGVGVILWYVTQITGTGLIVLNRQKQMSRIAMIGMVLTVVGCLGMIPLAAHIWHNGGIGAGLVDVGVEVYMNVAFLLALPRGTFDRHNISVFLRSATAVLPMLALMLLGHGSYQWVGVFVGVLVYVALCYKLGCLDKNDIQTLRQAFMRRGSAT